MMPWLAVTLEAEADAAEALSDALLEAGARSVEIDVAAPRPRLTALVDDAAHAAAIVAQAGERAGQGPIAYVAATVQDRDWVRDSQSQFAPITIGRLWVGPTWHEPPAGHAVVRIDPGLAFGTGGHATTRLMLAYLEKNLQPGGRVLDYGCGSGILAIAAAKLGAASVDAVDIDLQALAITAANARLNRVTPRAFEPGALAPARYDLVMANILLQPLVVLAPLLAARTHGDGRIALAGILERQADELGRAYAPWFDLETEASAEGWVLVAGARR
jgi:ribosomal protein L11 methyltransferase